MPKVKSFHGCFSRFKRDASKTTRIHSGEWTHVRGRKTIGMSEKEISKFLASKALKDAKLVRDLEVAPKKTMPYINPCILFGHSKNQCEQKEPRMKQLKKKAGQAKKTHKVIEPTKEVVEAAMQKNITNLCKSEDSIRRISKQLKTNLMRSKGLIEIQRKLYDHLFDMEVKRTGGLNSPLIISNGKNPKRTLKKLPLPIKVRKQFERIIDGRDELEKLDNRFTDYLIYMDQVEKRRLLLHCQLDYADYSKFHFVGPDGVLHKKPSAEPKPDTKYYDKANKQRIGSPRTVGLKSRNNIKCLRHVELMAKDVKNHKSDKMSKHVETEKVSIPVTSSRLDRA
jgi:hypothetical protein